jgi:hypothetical protein
MKAREGFCAAGDQNTFMFDGPGNNDLAKEIKEYIEAAMRKSGTPQAQTTAFCLSDELEKLPSLREQGILSEEEFRAAKMKLIG